MHNVRRCPGQRLLAVVGACLPSDGRTPRSSALRHGPPPAFARGQGAAGGRRRVRRRAWRVAAGRWTLPSCGGRAQRQACEQPEASPVDPVTPNCSFPHVRRWACPSAGFSSLAIRKSSLPALKSRRREEYPGTGEPGVVVAGLLPMSSHAGHTLSFCRPAAFLFFGLLRPSTRNACGYTQPNG